MLAGVGLSALTIGAKNKANNEQLLENVDAIKGSLEKQIGQLKEQSLSQQAEFSRKMTQVRYKGLKNTASTTNKIAESGLTGATASRLYNQSHITKLMAHNALAQEASDSSVSFGVEMENKRDAANNAIKNAGKQAAANYEDPIMGMIKGAVSGASLGTSLGSLDLAGMGSELLGDFEHFMSPDFANPALQAFKGGI